MFLKLTAAASRAPVWVNFDYVVAFVDGGLDPLGGTKLVLQNADPVVVLELPEEIEAALTACDLCATPPFKAPMG